MGSALPPPPPPASPTQLLSTSPRAASALLIVATITSVLATLALGGYALLPVVANAHRSHYTALYAVWLVSKAVAEGCQILFLLVLIALWFSPRNPQKKVREMVALAV
jgi:hypothetical protein